MEALRAVFLDAAGAFALAAFSVLRPAAFFVTVFLTAFLAGVFFSLFFVAMLSLFFPLVYPAVFAE